MTTNLYNSNIIDNIFFDKIMPREQFIEDSVFDGIIKKSNIIKNCDYCVIDYEEEEYLNINKKIETKIKNIIESNTKIKINAKQIKNIYVDFVTVNKPNKLNKNLHSLQKDFALIFFTKNDNLIVCNNQKFSFSKNDVLVIENTILFNEITCSDNLMFYALVNINLDQSGIIDTLIDSIEKDIMHYKFTKYNEDEILLKIIHALSRETEKHICVNIDIITQDSNFFSNMKNFFDLISNIYINDEHINFENKYMSLEKVREKIFLLESNNSIRFKIYFFQPKIKKTLYELKHLEFIFSERN
jgi:hypothetical protein